jgi:hypothetical protein
VPRPSRAHQKRHVTWRESFAGGTLQFDVKVSSQTTKDYFNLTIDGSQASGAKKSGEFGWATITVPVTKGVHTLVWTYTKDGSIDAGSDTVWLDNIRYIQGEDAGDSDGDGTADIDDTDDDNDGFPDTIDGMPKDPTESVDTDGDGIGNTADTDDDNDGLLDGVDPYPLDNLLWAVTDGAATNAGIGHAVAFAGDVDNDGFGDVVVGAYKSSPLVATCAAQTGGFYPCDFRADWPADSLHSPCPAPCRVMVSGSAWRVWAMSTMMATTILRWVRPRQITCPA